MKRLLPPVLFQEGAAALTTFGGGLFLPQDLADLQIWARSTRTAVLAAGSDAVLILAVGREGGGGGNPTRIRPPPPEGVKMENFKGCQLKKGKIAN